MRRGRLRQHIMEVSGGELRQADNPIPVGYITCRPTRSGVVHLAVRRNRLCRYPFQEARTPPSKWRVCAACLRRAYDGRVGRRVKRKSDAQKQETGSAVIRERQLKGWYMEYE